MNPFSLAEARRKEFEELQRLRQAEENKLIYRDGVEGAEAYLREIEATHIIPKGWRRMFRGTKDEPARHVPRE